MWKILKLLESLSRSFIDKVENDYSDPGDLTCGEPQGFILGPRISYVNDMQSTIKGELLLYANDSVIFTDKIRWPTK